MKEVTYLLLPSFYAHTHTHTHTHTHAHTKNEKASIKGKSGKSDAKKKNLQSNDSRKRTVKNKRIDLRGDEVRAKPLAIHIYISIHLSLTIYIYIYI